MCVSLIRPLIRLSTKVIGRMPPSDRLLETKLDKSLETVRFQNTHFPIYFPIRIGKNGKCVFPRHFALEQTPVPRQSALENTFSNLFSNAKMCVPPIRLHIRLSIRLSTKVKAS